MYLCSKVLILEGANVQVAKICLGLWYSWTFDIVGFVILLDQFFFSTWDVTAGLLLRVNAEYFLLLLQYMKCSFLLSVFQRDLNTGTGKHFYMNLQYPNKMPTLNLQHFAHVAGLEYELIALEPNFAYQNSVSFYFHSS